jgi:hypothetical protein
MVQGPMSTDAAEQRRWVLLCCCVAVLLLDDVMEKNEEIVLPSFARFAFNLTFKI